MFTCCQSGTQAIPTPVTVWVTAQWNACAMAAFPLLDSSAHVTDTMLKVEQTLTKLEKWLRSHKPRPPLTLHSPWTEERCLEALRPSRRSSPVALSAPVRAAASHNKHVFIWQLMPERPLALCMLHNVCEVRMLVRLSVSAS